MTIAARLLNRLLEAVTVTLLVALALVVVSAVVARYIFNSSFHWYDEVASVMLAWLTYFGAALAALRRAHMGFSGLILSVGRTGRALLFVFSESVVYLVLISMAWAGFYVLRIMAGDGLISLPWVSLQFTQSVVPVGCVLFVIAQILSTPESWARVMAGRDREAEEIREEIEKARAELDAGNNDGRDDARGDGGPS